MYKILINVEGNERRIAIVRDKALEELSVERSDTEQIVGNVYKARVENVVSGMQAAFVDIGLEKNGFLHQSDIIDPDVSYKEMLDDEVEHFSPGNGAKQSGKIEDMIKEGQEILVQVVKGQIGTKGSRLATNISLPGRYLVLMPNSSKSGISRKIVNREERARLKQVLANLKIPKGMGVIVRTVGAEGEQDRFRRDLRYLIGVWRRICVKKVLSKAPSCIHQELNLVFKTLRDSLVDDVDEILVDNREEFRKVRKFVGLIFPEMKPRVNFYRGKEPIFYKYEIEPQIYKALNRKVWLRCGGYIVIDRTEALTTIDVNTGKHVGSKDLEDTVHKTNVEAAVEIARQLRIRNMGGIIVIDFIDMKNRRNQKAVLQKLGDFLKKDRAKTSISAISPLGLVEMTRQRVHESWIGDMYEPCQCCSGKGVVKGATTMSLEIRRNAKKIFSKSICKKLKVYCHPEVASRLTGEDAKEVKLLEKQFRCSVEFFRGDSIYSFENVIYKTDSGKKIDIKKI